MRVMIATALLSAGVLCASALLSAALGQEAYTYDELGRLIEVVHEDGSLVRYSYDAAGNRTQVVQSGAPEAPIVVDDSITTGENTPKDFDPLANDSDINGDALTIVSVTNGSKGSVAIIDSGLRLRYTPNANVSGADSFTYTVSDGGAQTTGAVSVTIIAGADAPVAGDDSITTDEDVAKTFSPLANDTDADGDTLSIASVTNPTHGTAQIIGTTIRYTPAANYFGPDTFSYDVTDGALSDTGAVSVTVNSVNDAPIAVNDSISTNEDTAKTFDPRVNDSDVEGQALTITAKTNGSKGSVAILSGGTQLRYTPNANVNGSDSFTYTISDGAGGSASATVSVSIAAVNDAPIAVNDSISTNEDTAKTFDPRVNDSDVEGQALTITANTNGSKGSVAILSGGTQLRYTPNANLNGSDSFTYTISDGAGGSASATVSVSIAAINDPPVANDDTYNNIPRNQWTTLYVQMNDSDVEGQSLTITSVSGGSGSTQIVNVGGAINYMPGASTGASDNFSYTLSDGAGGTDTAQVTVFVQQTGGGGDPPGPPGMPPF